MAISLEAIQTIVPLKPTDQRQSYRSVQLPKASFWGNYQRSFQMVICDKALEGYSGWVVAGWFKESLGRALAEEPIFAGRLRRLEKGDVDGEHLEIVANDSGIRMVEANMQMNLDEFLDLKGETEDEAGLVFWEDIDEKNPQFSPLFFVQVTNFLCGGFSIGISCSLLVADPLSILSFIDKWSDIHKNIISSSITAQIPLFYLPNLGRIGNSPPIKINPCKGTKTAQSVTFEIETENFDFAVSDMSKNLVAQCLHEVEQKLGMENTISNLCILLKDISGNVKIESCTIKEIDSQKKSTPLSKIIFTSWDCLRVGNEYFSI
ncbi:hypothetical protein Leryth_015981, partial [Lithospermum erythrorhizon]